MTYHQTSSSPNINKIFGKQLLTPEQVQQASILELSSDPLLWAAYKRGCAESFSNNQVTYVSNIPDDNNHLSDDNHQNRNVINKNVNKKSFSQQYRLQKKSVVTHTNCTSNETKNMVTDDQR